MHAIKFYVTIFIMISSCWISLQLHLSRATCGPTRPPDHLLAESVNYKSLIEFYGNLLRVK